MKCSNCGHTFNCGSGWQKCYQCGHEFNVSSGINGPAYLIFGAVLSNIGLGVIGIPMMFYGGAKTYWETK